MCAGWPEEEPLTLTEWLSQLLDDGRRRLSRSWCVEVDRAVWLLAIEVGSRSPETQSFLSKLASAKARAESLLMRVGPIWAGAFLCSRDVFCDCELSLQLHVERKRSLNTVAGFSVVFTAFVVRGWTRFFIHDGDSHRPRGIRSEGCPASSYAHHVRREAKCGLRGVPVGPKSSQSVLAIG